MVDQDTDYVRRMLADQVRLEGQRLPWERVWREIDHFVNPSQSGGFDKQSPGRNYGQDLFDVTAVEHLDRGTSVLVSITTPRNQRWQGLVFANKELNALPSVRRWCEHATDRLFACRYAPHAGFETQIVEDARQSLSYGTAPLWIDEKLGRGLFYKALHLSEIYIDENYYGRVDKVHRKFELSYDAAAEQFEAENLSDRAQAKIREGKGHEKAEFLHVVRPNAGYLPGQRKFDHTGRPIEGVYIEIDAKHIVMRGGYYSMPIAVSRHITSPRDIYGRSPGMKILGVAKGLNEMAKTILVAAHKQTDPALAFFDDGDISALVSKPGGMNPGLVDEFGRLLVAQIPGGGNLPFGLEMLEREREIVANAFFEEYFKILSNPSDRMTATQVLETVQKQGVLVSPVAGRHETEKLGPATEREVDILMRRRQIAPFPPEVLEAGERPVVQMENPLARMARAEEASGFTRWVEVGVQAASAGAPQALERINFDKGMQDLAEVFGVRPSNVYTDDEVAAHRAARQEQEAAASMAAGVPDMAGAALDLAKANQIQQLAGGGGL